MSRLQCGCQKVNSGLFCLGLAVAVFAFVVMVVVPFAVNIVLTQELTLTSDSKMYKLWENTPIPMYLEFHLFNWTNPIETLRGEAKPHFVEMGPYVFSENHSKVNLRWNDNGTITFNQVRKWEFIPSQSNGSLDDIVTNVNVIAMTAAGELKNAPKLLYPIINEILDDSERQVFVTKTVRELLFEGYNDPILDTLQKLKKFIKVSIPFDKFGWFYGRNTSETYDGVFNMMTGTTTLSDLGEIERWNYASSSPDYSSECGQIRGTLGDLWPKDSSYHETNTIFSPDICSTLTLVKAESTKVKNLNVRVYTGDETLFDNGQIDTENSCYCTSNVCPPRGARDVSKCKYGAPAYVSSPHFYNADPVYLDMISGMAPSADKHKFFLALEKATSVPAEVHARIQINIYSEPIEGIKFYSSLPKAYMPMIWLDQRALITTSLSDDLALVSWTYIYLTPTCLAVFISAIVLVAATSFIWMLRRIRNARSTALLSAVDSRASSPMP